MASPFRTDPGSAVSPVCCSGPLTDWHQSVSEADHHLWGINPSLDWIMITLHFHVPGNHVFLFMWHRDIRELINRCFFGNQRVWMCIWMHWQKRLSSLQLILGCLQEVHRRRPGCRGSVWRGGSGRQTAASIPAYKLSLSYILHPPSRVPFGLESITRHCEVTSDKWRQRAPGKHRLDMLFFSTVS